MVLYSHNWTNIGFSFIILTVNLFCHPTLIKHGLYVHLFLIEFSCDRLKHFSWDLGFKHFVQKYVSNYILSHAFQ